MLRFYVLGVLVFLGAVATLAATIGGPGWWLLLAVAGRCCSVVGVYDLVQKQHSMLRNYPVLGHLRFLLEGIRPELQQYFIERNFDGRPYDRDTRTSIYQRAKGIEEEQPFGTERDVDAARLRVPRALHRRRCDPLDRAAAGPDRRPGLHPALRHGPAQRLAR